jgi:Uma2 family endonuclease
MSTVPNIGNAGGFIAVVAPGIATSSVPQFRRFTVKEFYRLAEVGVLREKERVELLEGYVTMMSPIGPPHSTCVNYLYRAFLRILPTGRDYTNGRDVQFSESSTEPDGLVLRGSLGDFSNLVVTAKDVLLVIEVAETSLSVDRGIKQGIYAAASVPEYWIVNLPERKLEVYRRPVAATNEQSAKYETVDVYLPEQSVDVVIDGTKVGSIVVRDILP